MHRTWLTAAVVTGIILLGANVVLLLQNRFLKEQVNETIRQKEAASKVPPGTALPPFEGYNIFGELVELGYREEPCPTLLLAFTPSCSFCDDNWASWEALIDRLRGSVRIIGVDLTATAGWSFFMEHGMGDAVAISEVHPRVLQAYRLNRVPTTLLIQPDGIAETVWLGPLTEQATADLLARVNRIVSEAPRERRRVLRDR